MGRCSLCKRALVRLNKLKDELECPIKSHKVKINRNMPIYLKEKNETDLQRSMDTSKKVECHVGHQHATPHHSTHRTLLDSSWPHAQTYPTIKLSNLRYPSYTWRTCVYHLDTRETHYKLTKDSMTIKGVLWQLKAIGALKQAI